MAIARHEIDPFEQLSIRLRVAEIMVATAVAVALRSGDVDQRRRMLEELRRNVLVAVEEVHPSTDQANVLATEESVDQLLDQIVRLARIA